MTIIFDKNLSTERSIAINFFTEQLLDRRLHANWEKNISDSTEIPDVSGFINNKNFNTIEVQDNSINIPDSTDEVQDNSINIPVQGTYNRIAQVSTTYIAENKSYNLTIVLEYDAAE